MPTYLMSVYFGLRLDLDPAFWAELNTPIFSLGCYCSPLEAITSYLNLNLCCKDYRYEIVEAVGPEVAAGQVTAPEAGEHLVHPGVQQVAGARLHNCRYQLKGRMRFLRIG